MHWQNSIINGKQKLFLNILNLLSLDILLQSDGALAAGCSNTYI